MGAVPRQGDQPAITDVRTGEVLSYAAFARRVTHAAAGLRGHGLRYGDRVLVDVPLGAGLAVAVHSVALCGGVAVLGSSGTARMMIAHRGWDPAAVEVLPWGTIEFGFTSCNQAQLTYAGPQAWGSGTRTVSRLTALAELECTGKRQLHASGARMLSGLRSRSGAWFDPAHNGEGWNVEELPDGRAQVYWFTYDGNGEQAWTIGVSPSSGPRMVVFTPFSVWPRMGVTSEPA